MSGATEKKKSEEKQMESSGKHKDGSCRHGMAPLGSSRTTAEEEGCQANPVLAYHLRNLLPPLLLLAFIFPHSHYWISILPL